MQNQHIASLTLYKPSAARETLSASWWHHDVHPDACGPDSEPNTYQQRFCHSGHQVTPVSPHLAMSGSQGGCSKCDLWPGRGHNSYMSFIFWDDRIMESVILLLMDMLYYILVCFPILKEVVPYCTIPKLCMKLDNNYQQWVSHSRVCDDDECLPRQVEEAYGSIYWYMIWWMYLCLRFLHCWHIWWCCYHSVGRGALTLHVPVIGSLPCSVVTQPHFHGTLISHFFCGMAIINSFWALSLSVMHRYWKCNQTPLTQDINWSVLTSSHVCEIFINQVPDILSSVMV